MYRHSLYNKMSTVKLSVCCRVRNFLDTNVDLMEYNEPIELMFDVTVFKADKQVGFWHFMRAT